MRRYVKVFGLIISVTVATFVAPFSIAADVIQSNYQLCFTPGGNCANNIVNAIENAKKQILVQAFLFTSHPIANALIAAHQRGVDVEVIFDKKTCVHGKKNICQSFVDHAFPVWIDNSVRVAHNKVMILDGETVVTGSYNFTNAAQKHNAENSLIIDNSELAQKYIANWQSRKTASQKWVG